jgi:hypothetical protein
MQPCYDHNMPSSKRKRVSRLHSKDPVDAAWRAQQARVDADIAGLSRDPVLEALVDQWDAEGATTEEIIERIKGYVRERQRLAGKDSERSE